MTELFLHVPLIDLGGRGDTCAKGLAGKLTGSLDLTEIAADAGRHCSPLHKPGHFIIIQPLRSDSFALARDPAEEGPCASLTNLIQVSIAATGQVASAEPRPTSTSRHPALPRRVISMPLSRISIQLRPSSV